MAKHKAQRALFELLAKERDQAKAKPDAGTATRPVGAPPSGLMQCQNNVCNR